MFGYVIVLLNVIVWDIFW